MSSKNVSANRILDKALSLAESSSWEELRLYQVAEALEIPLEAIHKHFDEKEDMVKAWFDRADTAMLKEAESEDFQSAGTKNQIHRLIMTWLSSLGKHKKVTKQMICGKFEPGHLHVLLPAVLHVSRTVQWMREATHRKPAFAERAIEETALTALFLLTIFRWLRDDSQDSLKTSQFLALKLNYAESLRFTVPDFMKARW